MCRRPASSSFIHRQVRRPASYHYRRPAPSTSRNRSFIVKSSQVVADHHASSGYRQVFTTGDRVIHRHHQVRKSPGPRYTQVRRQVVMLVILVRYGQRQEDAHAHAHERTHLAHRHTSGTSVHIWHIGTHLAHRRIHLAHLAHSRTRHRQVITTDGLIHSYSSRTSSSSQSGGVLQQSER